MHKSFLVALAGSAAILFAGSVSAVAAPKGPEGRIEAMMERLDTDQSGAVSYEEFAKRGDDRFARMDADGDGLVTAEEREAAKAAAKAEFSERKGKGKRGGKMRGPGGEARLERIDTDKDGNISLAEHNAAQEQHFAALDADGSGAVTSAEFIAEMEKRRAQFLERRGQ
ncbi:MAG: hypothetical protein AAF337_00840 [Pseudomonadota bacterium]